MSTKNIELEKTIDKVTLSGVELQPKEESNIEKKAAQSKEKTDTEKKTSYSKKETNTEKREYHPVEIIILKKIDIPILKQYVF